MPLEPVNTNVTDAGNIQTLGRRGYFYKQGIGWIDLGLLESVAIARANTRKTFKNNRIGKTQTFKDIPDDDTQTFTIQTGSTGDSAVRGLFTGGTAIATGGTVPAAFAATTDLDLGDYVSASGRYYEVTTAGKTGAAAPVWPNVAGQTVASGTVTFTDRGTAAPAASQTLAYADTAAVTYGGFILVRETNEAGGSNIIRGYPTVQIAGNGEPDIQGFDGLEFLLTVLGAKEFTPPAAYGNFGTVKPDGVVYQVSKANSKALEDALADAIKTAVDAS